MDHFPPRYDLVDKYRNNYVLEQFGLKMGLPLLRMVVLINALFVLFQE
jgi:hypothetical protein